MGSRADKLEELDNQTRVAVLRRDNGKCALCKQKSNTIHEVVSKSHFGTKTLHICMQVKNRIVLCRDCHDLAQGKEHWIRYLLQLLEGRHKYSYPEEQFQRYLRE